MTPPQIESRTYRTSGPAKRGRKPYTTPEVIDVTGRTHFMVVRKLQANKKPKKKINNFECRNCELNDEYVDILEERMDKLESLVNNLTDKVTNLDTASRNSVIPNECYSSLDINSLLTVSQILCNNISSVQQQVQQVSPATTIESEFTNEMLPEFWDTTDIGDLHSSPTSIGSLHSPPTSIGGLHSPPTSIGGLHSPPTSIGGQNFSF